MTNSGRAGRTANMVPIDIGWHPGRGPDQKALARLTAYAERPRESMGEAWFMGEERERFTYMMESELSALTSSQLARPLSEIASGNCNFGPMEEWHQWLLYLLPRLIPIALRPGFREVQELLVTALMATYPERLDVRRYPQFREDVLRTLGMCIMDGSKWNQDKSIPGAVLRSPPNARVQIGGWGSACGDLSSSMFLFLKYLEPEEIAAWATSAFDIGDPHWRAQLLVWLAGARSLFDTPGLQPADVFMQAPKIDWEWSHVLRSNYTGDFSEPVEVVPFLPHANKQAFKVAVRAILTGPVLDAWKLSIYQHDYLLFEAGGIIDSLSFADY